MALRLGSPLRTSIRLQLKVTSADIILFVTFLLLSLTSYTIVQTVFPPGAIVSIKSRGKTLYVLPLNRDKKVTVENSHGRNCVEIKQGRVRISDADCPQRLCMKQGWIDRGSLICLPNRLIVTVESGIYDDKQDSSSLDAITR